MDDVDVEVKSGCFQDRLNSGEVRMNKLIRFGKFTIEVAGQGINGDWLILS